MDFCDFFECFGFGTKIGLFYALRTSAVDCDVNAGLLRAPRPRRRMSSCVGIGQLSVPWTPWRTAAVVSCASAHVSHLGRRTALSLCSYLTPHTRRVLGGGWLCGSHRQTFACLCMRRRRRTRGNPDRGTRPLRHLRTDTPRCSLASSGIQSCSRHCDGSLRAKTRSHPTFLAIVLASSSNMTSTPLP